MTHAVAPAAARDPVLSSLANISIDRGAGELGTRLLELEAFVRDNIHDVERALDEVPRNERVINAAAHHLLDIRGKYLRPMCVVLASRVGTGFSPAARQLALAVELVHNATLLHDDASTKRRPAAVAPRRASPTATPPRSSPATGCSSARCSGCAAPSCPACSIACCRSSRR